MSQSAYIWFPVARVSTAELNNGAQCRDRDHPVRLQLEQQVVACSAGSRRCVLATADGQLMHFGILFGRSYDQNEAWLPKMLVPADVQHVPRNMLSARVRMRQVACGDAHCLAVDVRDRLWVCGSNIHGQLGDPALLDCQSEFQQIRLEPNDVAVDPNEQNPSHFVYISDEDDGTLVDANANNAQPSHNTRVFHVAAGSSHSAAIAEVRGRKKLYTWGNGKYGANGLIGISPEAASQTTPCAHPVLESTAGMEPARVIAGAHLTVVVTVTGRFLVFGQVDPPSDTAAIVWLPLVLRSLRVAPMTVHTSVNVTVPADQYQSVERIQPMLHDQDGDIDDELRGHFRSFPALSHLVVCESSFVCHLSNGELLMWPGRAAHRERHSFNVESASTHPFERLNGTESNLPQRVSALSGWKNYLLMGHGSLLNQVTLLDLDSGHVKHTSLPDSERLSELSMGSQHALLVTSTSSSFPQLIQSLQCQPTGSLRTDVSLRVSSVNLPIHSIILRARLPHLFQLLGPPVVSVLGESDRVDVSMQHNRWLKQLVSFFAVINQRSAPVRLPSTGCCTVHQTVPVSADSPPFTDSELVEMGIQLRFYDQTDSMPRPNWYRSLLKKEDRLRFDQTLSSLFERFDHAVDGRPNMVEQLLSGCGFANSSKECADSASFLPQSALYQEFTTTELSVPDSGSKLREAYHKVMQIVCAHFDIVFQKQFYQFQSSSDHQLDSHVSRVRCMLPEHEILLPVITRWCYSGELSGSSSALLPRAVKAVLLTYSIIWQEDALFAAIMQSMDPKFKSAASASTNQNASEVSSDKSLFQFHKLLFKQSGLNVGDDVVFLVSDLDFNASAGQSSLFEFDSAVGSVSFTSFPASRTLVALRSSFYAQLFESSTRRVFFVSDCCVDVFALALQWMYTDCICESVSFTQICLLIMFADRIGCDELRSSAERLFHVRSRAILDRRLHCDLIPMLTRFHQFADRYHAQTLLIALETMERQLVTSNDELPSYLRQTILQLNQNCTDSSLQRTIGNLIQHSQGQRSLLADYLFMEVAPPSVASSQPFEPFEPFAAFTLGMQEYGDIEWPYFVQSTVDLVNAFLVLIALLLFTALFVTRTVDPVRDSMISWSRPCYFLGIVILLFSIASQILHFMFRQRKRLSWWRAQLVNAQVASVNRQSDTFHCIEDSIALRHPPASAPPLSAFNDLKSIALDLSIDSAFESASGIESLDQPLERRSSVSSDNESVPPSPMLFSSQPSYTMLDNSAATSFEFDLRRDEMPAAPRMPPTHIDAVLAQIQLEVGAEHAECQRILQQVPSQTTFDLYTKDANGQTSSSAVALVGAVWLRLCLIAFLSALISFTQVTTSVIDDQEFWTADRINLLWIPLHLGSAELCLLLLYVLQRTCRRWYTEHYLSRRATMGRVRRCYLPIGFALVILLQVSVSPAFLFLLQVQLLLYKLINTAAMSWNAAFVPLFAVTGASIALLALFDLAVLIVLLVALLHTALRQMMLQTLQTSLQKVRPFIGVKGIVTAAVLLHAMVICAFISVFQLARYLNDLDYAVSYWLWLAPLLVSHVSLTALMVIVALVKSSARDEIFNVWGNDIT